MEANYYLVLGLPLDRVACNCFRKSRLMLASSFLVGTLFSSSRFSRCSTIEFPSQVFGCCSELPRFLPEFARLCLQSLGLFYQSFDLAFKFVHGEALR
jgi:hypothetical protein